MTNERWYEALWMRLTHLHLSLAYRLVWLGARLGHRSSKSVYRAMWDANLALPILHNDRLQSCRGPLTPLGEALHGIGDDYMTSEKHHPGYVLIPTARFERLLQVSATFSRVFEDSNIHADTQGTEA